MATVAMAAATAAAATEVAVMEEAAVTVAAVMGAAAVTVSAQTPLIGFHNGANPAHDVWAAIAQQCAKPGSGQRRLVCCPVPGSVARALLQCAPLDIRAGGYGGGYGGYGGYGECLKVPPCNRTFHFKGCPTAAAAGSRRHLQDLSGAAAPGASLDTDSFGPQPHPHWHFGPQPLTQPLPLSLTHSRARQAAAATAAAAASAAAAAAAAAGRRGAPTTACSSRTCP